ncbi:MAG: ADP-ribosylglycohydrolase family protein [Desulfobacterales bacterium]
MLGAIAGDMIGAIYEMAPTTRKDFPLFTKLSDFTDDTVLTVATADCLLRGGDYAEAYRRFARAHPRRGYGQSFRSWAFRDDQGPYGSMGNGSAMRVSPVGFACDSVEQVLAEAKRSAEVTHNHPDGIKGAQAAALAVFLARTGAEKKEIREEISGRFGYRLDRSLKKIRENPGPVWSAPGSVPEAIICFLKAKSVEDAIRNAVSLGGDADTQACIAGGIAEAFFGGVQEEIASEVRKRLPEDFLAIVEAFYDRFVRKSP